MKEYIDREAIYNILADEKPFGWTNDDLAEAVRNAVPADVVEVVRCKDCKWFVYDMDLNHETYPNEIEADGICQITEKYCDMPHFCSYGERR